MEGFRNRTEGGRALAEILRREPWEDPVVLALPRGGVAVAWEVARALDAPLDVIVSRKLGVPEEPEVGMGAVAEGGGLWIDREIVRAAGVDEATLAEVVARETAEVERGMRRWRGGRPLPPVAGRTVLLVDDGVARGGTARAALRSLRPLRPRRLVLAAPVIAAETAPAIVGEADEVLCVIAPSPFVAVGLWYADFGSTTDAEVAELLARARREREAAAGAHAPG
jgi:putative phosphoribosyl transferase